MENYGEYLKDLKNTAIFQEIEEADLLKLLESFAFKIEKRKANEPMGPLPKNKFMILLRAYPSVKNTKTRFKYDMPDLGASGFLMAEIPALSVMSEGFKNRPERPASLVHKPPKFDTDVLIVDVDVLLTYQGDKLWAAQSKLLRNLLGMLAQKVCDVRQELFLLRDGYDMYKDQDTEQA
jgi:hypothetical protein